MFNTFHALWKLGQRLALLPLLTLLLLVSVTLPANADDTHYTDGDGYYMLFSAEDLQWFADEVYNGNNKICGRLYNDVYLSSLSEKCWRPIGGVQPGYSGSHVFKGKFDGQNKVIYGLKIRPFVETGLFGRTDSATIENVIIDEPELLTDSVISLDTGNSHITQGSQMAVVVGNASCTTVRNCHVRNAILNPVSLQNGTRWYMVGGICGSAADESLVKNCSMSGCVASNHEGVGGIVGYLQRSTIDSCHVYGTKIGNTKISGTNGVGGICGVVNRRTIAASIVGCTVTDSIELYVTNDTATAVGTICGAQTLSNELEEFDGYYEINTPANLVEFASKVNGGETSAKARLMSDINMSASGEFTPMGSESKPFCGVFEGNGHTIDSLTIKNQQYAGLFGYVKDGSIKDLTLSNPTLLTQDNNYLGFIVGFLTQNSGHATPVGYIENCHVTNGQLLRNGDGEPYYIGGIAGKADMSAAIRYCSFQGIIKAHEQEIGGIVGQLHSGATVSQSIVMGPSTVWGDKHVGGIIGYLKNSDTDVVDCYVDQSAGQVEIHGQSGSTGTIWGTNDGKGEVSHTKYTEDGVLYEQTGRYVNTEEGRATETKVVGVSTQGGDYHVYADIGATYDYKTSVIESMKGAGTVDFIDVKSDKNIATACNWIDIEIADYAFDSSLKGLYMRYYMKAGLKKSSDHTVMLTPKDVRPQGKNMLLYAPNAKIYVDAEYYDAFCTDSLWSAYKDRIVPTTFMRTEDVNAEYGARYAYDRNRDKSGSIVTHDNGSVFGSSQVHVIGADDSYLTNDNGNVLWIYQDIGQTYDYNTTKIWASSFNGKDNIKQVKFQEITKSADGASESFNIAIGDSAFANCKNLTAFNVALYSDEGNDHVEFLHPRQIPIGKGVFDNSSKAKIMVPRDLVDEFKYDTKYGWAQYKDIIEAGDFGNNDYTEDGVIYSYFTSEDGQTYYTNKNNEEMEKIVVLWSNMYTNFSPSKVLEYNNSSTIKYMLASGVKADKIEKNDGVMRLYCDIGETYPNHYKTIALSGTGFQYQTSIKKIVFEDIVANNYNTVTDLNFVIPDNTFRGCSNLKELSMFYYVTRGENNYNGIKPSQIFIGQNVFDGVSKDFRIVVLPEYYNDYITDPNWSRYKDYIVAADYLPFDSDEDPVTRKGITYDYVSKSLNNKSTSDIARLQSSAWNWVLPAIFAASVATSGGVGFVGGLTSWVEEAALQAFVNAAGLAFSSSEAAVLAGLVVTAGTDELLNSTAQNYLANRLKKNYSRPATWKTHGIWITTEQITSIPNMYISQVDDSETNITIYNDPGQNSQDYRTIGIERTAFHNKTNLKKIHFQDRYGESSESLTGMQLSLPDSCFAGCTNLELFDLVIYSSGDGFGRYNGLTPDNFIPYGDIFAGLDKSKIKIRVSREAYPEFIEDDYWKQYKDMYQIVDVEEKQKQDEWKCKYSLAFNNNTIPLRTQSQGHDIEHVYIYGPGSKLEKTGLAALINDFGNWNNYKLDFVKSKAFYGNSNLKTLEITDTHSNIADVYTDFDISLLDSAFANCKNFENFNIIYQVTDGDNHTESIKPSQITLGNGVFDGCDKLRLKFCLDQEQAFLADTAWVKYKDKFRPCFFEPRDEKVRDILLDSYRFKTDLNSASSFDHVDATLPKPEDLKNLFKGQTIQSFDEFRAFGCCGLKTIYNGMFYGCSSLQSIILPDSITSIETDAFRGCVLLHQLTIPARVTSIQANAFAQSGIKEFIVKSAVPADIDAAKVFSGLDDSYMIYVADSVVDKYKAKWAAVSDHINSLSKRRGLKVVKLSEPGTLAKELGLTYNYTESIFSDNSLLGNYAHIDSLRVIGPVDGRDIGVIRYLGGRDVDDNCVTPGHLQYLDLYEANLVSAGHYEYNRAYFDNDRPTMQAGWSNNYIENDNEISAFMFWGLDQLKTLILPKTATKIKVGAFEHCTNLQVLVIGDDMTDIATRYDQNYVALSTPNKLALVMLGNSVPETSEKAFFAGEGLHVSRLNSVYYYSANDSRFTAAIVPYNAVKSYTSSVAYTSTCDSIIANFEDAALVEALKTQHVFSTIDLLNTTSVKGFFNGNKDIQKFNELYYSSVTTLGDSTFTGMSGLVEMTLPVGLRKITAKAFQGCSSLQRINAFGVSIPELEDSAFDSLPTDFVIMVNEGQEEAYRNAWPQYKNHIQGYRDASLDIREITLTAPNTLADSLDASVTMDGNMVVAVGGNFGNLSALKINGPIGGKDLAIIRYLGGREPDWNNPVYVTNLKYLDLYNAELRADNYYFMLKGINRRIENDNEVPKDMLWNCDNLETVILPRSATKLCYEACYDMASLKRLVIGDNVTYIDNDALGDNRNLKDIIFLCTSKPKLDGDAFTDPIEGGKRKVEKMYVRQDLLYRYSLDEEFTSHTNQITNGFGDAELFRAFGSKAIATEDDLASVTSVRGWFTLFPNITKLDMLNRTKVASIGKDEFRTLKNLKQVAFPSTLSTIDAAALDANENLAWADFSACDSLKTDFSTLKRTSGSLLYQPQSFSESQLSNVVYGKSGALQCADYFLTDTRGYDVPKAFTAKKVTFGREFTPRAYSTITLPFAVNDVPDNFKFYTLNTDSTRNDSLYFKPAGTLAANSPYVVRAKAKTLKIEAETLVPSTNAHTNSVRGMGYALVGNIQPVTSTDVIEAKLILFDPATMTWNKGTQLTDSLPPFTAYAQVTNSTAATKNVVSRFSDCLFHYYVGSTIHDLYGENTSDDPLFAGKVVLEDGKDFRADAPFTAQEAIYTRSSQNQWGTLCLPYAFDASDNTTCDYYQISEKQDTALVLTHLEGEVEAGTPVLVRRNDLVKAFTVDAYNTEVAIAPLTLAGDNTAHLEGTFEQIEVGKGAYIISNDRFWLVDNLVGDKNVKVGSKPFRAYLSGVTGTKAASFGLVEDHTVSGVDPIEMLTDEAAEYYDLNGRRIPELQKGVNIVKRGTKTTKVIIK